MQHLQVIMASGEGGVLHYLIVYYSCQPEWQEQSQNLAPRPGLPDLVGNTARLHKNGCGSSINLVYTSQVWSLYLDI